MAPVAYTENLIRAGFSDTGSSAWPAGSNMEDFIMAKKKKKKKT